MKKNNFIKITVLIFILLSLYLFISSVIGDPKKFGYLKTLFNEEQRELIKKYIFPYKLIDQQRKELEFFKPLSAELEIITKEQGIDLTLIKESNFKLSDNKSLTKLKINTGFHFGIANTNPGSAYIDFYEQNFFIVSSRGVLAYGSNIEKENSKLKQIKNNIDKFISLKQFKKSQTNSIKDLFIGKEHIYISFTDEIEEDCWNTSLIYGKINFEEIIFKKLFTSKKCINSINPIDNKFNAMSAGGRIIQFDSDHILLSMGEYLNSYLAQDEESDNGKIIKINIRDGSHKLISKGHRNPQGLYFDKENKFIIQTEHGPKGGDEINLIYTEEINNEKILNFGWPISSYGEHYDNKIDQSLYSKYPLYKSHEKYGFIEPIKFFTPSIGISEIAKIKNKKFVVSSLKYKSLYFFELDHFDEIVNIEKIEVGERIRDMKFFNNKLYLFMEDTASIGVIDLIKF
jgi:hypothetical protein